MKFDPEERSRRPKWLDLVFDLDSAAGGKDLRLELYNHNRDFLLGVAESPGRMRHARWVGCFPTCFGVTRGTLLGLLARATTAGLDDQAVAAALGLEVADMMSSGFPATAIRAVLFSLGGAAPGVRKMQKIWVEWMRRRS